MKLPQTTLLIILIIALFTSGITAATQPDTTLYIDPPEFTLNEQSEGCGYYVPWYSQHHYNIDGTATITFPNKSTILIDPRTQTQEKPHATVSRIFELPNGAGAFPGDNALTATYDDDPILWVTFDPGLPKLKDDSNHPTPAAGDPAPSWVEWITITPPHHTKYQSFTTRWTVPENPPITKDKPDPYITNRGSGNVFFIFNGFESKTNAVLSQGFTSGIVQPILIWNCGTIHPTKKTCTGYPKDEHWSIAAWADFNSASTHGTPMPTHPGNTIEGKTEYSEKTATWAVTITDLTTGKTSRLLNIKMIPNDSNTIEPVIALENYGASLICKNGKFNDEWPQSTIKFSNFNLQDSNKNNIIKKSHITADYNHHRFQNPDTNKLCERLDNPPTNDKQHYYIDTTTWPESITFQTSGTIKEVTEDL